MENENILLEKEIKHSVSKWIEPSKRKDDDDVTLIFGVEDSIVLTRKQIVGLNDQKKISESNREWLKDFIQ